MPSNDEAHAFAEIFDADTGVEGAPDVRRSLTRSTLSSTIVSKPAPLK